MIRPATLADVDRLLEIEHLCFQGDRLSKRHFHYLLTKGHTYTLVEEQPDIIRGYALVLLHQRTRIARLYSLAIAPPFQGQGLALDLLEAIEQIALTQQFTRVRLEVRYDNFIAQQLYEKRGYQKLKTITHYYDDHATAFRFEKKLKAPGTLDRDQKHPDTVKRR